MQLNFGHFVDQGLLQFSSPLVLNSGESIYQYVLCEWKWWPVRLFGGLVEDSLNAFGGVTVFFTPTIMRMREWCLWVNDSDPPPSKHQFIGHGTFVKDFQLRELQLDQSILFLFLLWESLFEIVRCRLQRENNDETCGVKTKKHIHHKNQGKIQQEYLELYF